MFRICTTQRLNNSGKIETLHQKCEVEQLIESIAATVQDAHNGQTFRNGITSNLEHPNTDLADTLTWICLNTSLATAEVSNPTSSTDTSCWHRSGARPKVPCPTKTWAEVVCSKVKPTKRAPMLTPLLEIPLKKCMTP